MNNKMRVRTIFAKTEAMRYTGHLDLYRTWERTIRRAKLPMAYSGGFRAHPKINLASALPLGFTGQNEILDFYLEQELPTEEIQTRLQNATPPGIEVLEVKQVETSKPALQQETSASEYILTFLNPQPELSTLIQEIISATSLPRTRRGKQYDLRQLILEIIILAPGADGLERLCCVMSAAEGATGRPEEIVLELGEDPAFVRFHRTRLIFINSTAD